MAEWEAKGWEIAAWEEGRFRGELILRKEMPERRGGFRTPTGWLVMAVVAGLVIASIGVFTASDYFSEARADARAAVRALKNGDLAALDKRLVANRGQPDFAYFFTSKATPRDIGDALATVAGSSEDAPFKAGVDTYAYELILTDLAGTLALATHGRRQRALPESWTADFIAATTTPLALYGEHDGFFDTKGKQREKQDLANKANLLLLLSRGYWSSEFLQAVTKGYYEFDRREGDDAWPSADPDDDVKYAPAPSGVYLTDGVLALTAALTANPAASEWAFTEFQPGTEKIDRSEYTIGKFTHYLLFERRFPETPDGGSVGMTSTLTALSSAIDSASWAEGTQAAVSANASSNDVGPMHDAAVLQALAHDLAEKSWCSGNPLDYGHCVIDAAKAVWRWVRHWGHLVLDILTLPTFAPPPFSAVGIAAAASNATWYAIEGDYGMAGLSLAAAVPGLAFVKIAKGVKAGAAAKKAAAGTDDVAKAAEKSAEVAKAANATRLKPWNDCSAVRPGGISLRYREDWTKEQRRAADEKVKAYYEAAQKGELKNSLSQRSGTSASSRYTKAGGTVPDGAEVDHTIDLQLGGIDDPSNMKPLDATVNKSLGAQVQQQLKELPFDQLITTAAIC